MQVIYEFLHLIFCFRQCIVRHVASLAQLVEHLICNQRVVGSSPTTGTRISAGVPCGFLFVKKIKVNYNLKRMCSDARSGL